MARERRERRAREAGGDGENGRRLVTARVYSGAGKAEAGREAGSKAGVIKDGA